MSETPQTFDEKIAGLCHKDPRFTRGAYEFLFEALDFTMRDLARENCAAAGRHVTARELLEGLRDYALQEFGPLAFLTLRRMGLTSCDDVGDIVFLLVGCGLLAKKPTDRRRDFSRVYDFEAALRTPFNPIAKPPKKKGTQP